jgi:predicted unusual protein kinase regulating ubiquinone biosynthesis (AarF/ABC1/UbiB family)
MPFQLPENFLLIVRAMSLTSGMCSSLNPAFNIWDAVEPYAAQLLRDERGNIVQSFAREAATVGTTLARLPRRLDEAVTRLEDGRVAVDTPRLDRRLARLERMAGRILSAVLFAGLLISGAVLRADELVFGTVLMVGSAVPLAYAVLGGLNGRRG